MHHSNTIYLAKCQHVNFFILKKTYLLKYFKNNINKKILTLFPYGKLFNGFGIFKYFNTQVSR